MPSKYTGEERRVVDCPAEGCQALRGQGKGQRLLWAVVLTGVFCSPIATIAWVSAEVRATTQAVLMKLDHVSETFSMHQAENARFEGMIGAQMEGLREKK